MSTPFGNSILKIFSALKPQASNFHFRNVSVFRKSKEQKEEQSPYIIVKATKDDHEEILKGMHEAYFPEEPTCYSLGVTQNAVLDEGAMKAMAEGMSLVARCKHDGCIVGACVNESCHPWDPEIKEKLACHVKCPRVRQLLLFYAHMQRAPNLWNCFGVQKIFEMAYLFVKRDHRKKGIAYRLIRDSRSLAADCGFGLVRCDATSNHTAGLCEKLNMTRIYSIPYCTYLGPNLEPVFNPPFPHEVCKVYVDCAPQLNHLLIKAKENKTKTKKKQKAKEKRA